MGIPSSAIRSLHSIPTTISSSFPPDFPLHGLLAADLSFEASHVDVPWKRVLPTQADFEASLPLMWPKELHEYLPSAAYGILKRQQNKFQLEWDSVSKAFPEMERSAYMYNWFVINTRTFFHKTPEMEKYSWEDKLALVPAADLFNHSNNGCEVTWSVDEGYDITTNRTYNAGEELFISYGKHSNDFLLVEYGFTMPGNPYDEVGLDEVIMPKLGNAQRDALVRQGFLGDFRYGAATGPCIRTQAAVAQLLESDPSNTSGVILENLLRELWTFAGDMRLRIDELQIGDETQRDLLIQRWTQIEKVVLGGNVPFDM